MLKPRVEYGVVPRCRRQCFVPLPFSTACCSLRGFVGIVFGLFRTVGGGFDRQYFVFRDGRFEGGDNLGLHRLVGTQPHCLTKSRPILVRAKFGTRTGYVNVVAGCYVIPAARRIPWSRAI